MTTATNHPDPYATRRRVATLAVIAGFVLVVVAWFINQNAQDAYEHEQGVAEVGRMVYGYNAFVDKPNPTVPIGLAVGGALAVTIGFVTLASAPPRLVDIRPNATGVPAGDGYITPT